MKKNNEINLCFLDFWDGFNSYDNFFIRYFTELLKETKINITSSENSNLVIYSVFGKNNLNVDRNKTKKIFFTGENVQPDLLNSDFCFTFDVNDYDGKNIRIPLWYHYIDWFNKGSYKNEPEHHLIHPSDFNETWFKKPKTKMCCAIFSNPKPERFKMIDALSKYMTVDGYGKPFNNMSHGITDKYEKMSQYKVSICFENGIGSGYVTEKLLHARTCGNLAIYWGTDDVKIDFNENGFINLKNFASVDDCAFFVKTILENPSKYKNIVNQPIFNCKFFTFNDKVKNILMNL